MENVIRTGGAGGAAGLVQQGDVLFYAVDGLPGGLKPRSRSRPGLATFAEGEATGHHHSCAAEDVELYEDAAGVLWCRVLAPETVVTHQEHKPVTLRRGDYRINFVREYDPFAERVRVVVD